jgi:hypothetical protein
MDAVHRLTGAKIMKLLIVCEVDKKNDKKLFKCKKLSHFVAFVNLDCCLLPK